MIKLTSKLNHVVFAGISWACSAASHKDPTRPALNYVKVDIDSDKITKFTGCDGHRLHMFTEAAVEGIGEYKAGLFEIAKNTKSEIILTECTDEDMVYPDVENVMPDHEKWETKIGIEAVLREPSISCNYARLIKALDKKVTVQFEFFKQFVAVGAIEVDLKINTDNALGGVVLEAAGYEGVLMPIKISVPEDDEEEEEETKTEENTDAPETGDDQEPPETEQGDPGPAGPEKEEMEEDLDFLN